MAPKIPGFFFFKSVGNCCEFYSWRSSVSDPDPRGFTYAKFFLTPGPGSVFEMRIRVQGLQFSLHKLTYFPVFLPEEKDMQYLPVVKKDFVTVGNSYLTSPKLG
jgi:hypothetical protein